MFNMLWSLMPQRVCAASISSHRVNNETMGTRYLMEKLGAAGSKDETLLPPEHLIDFPSCLHNHRRRETDNVAAGEQERELVTAGGRSILPGWLAGSTEPSRAQWPACQSPRVQALDSMSPSSGLVSSLHYLSSAPSADHGLVRRSFPTK